MSIDYDIKQKRSSPDINRIKTSNKWKKKVINSWQLYLVFLLPLLYIIIFNYIPMYGALIAFKQFVPTKGILGSEWVGLKYFKDFVTSYQFWRLLKNTLGISFYSIVAGFPIPIILALLLNYVKHERFKKTVQMVTYAPHFISTVVMVSIILQFLAPRLGIINKIMVFLGGNEVNFIAVPEYFKSIYVWSGIWQGAGYGSIIYIAALAGIDPALHEVAITFGATKLQRIWYIDIPSIMPTAIIMLILSCGSIMSVGFEKIFLMQNSMNMQASDVIATYVYRIGLVGAQYSYSTAIGLFNSVVNMILLISVNQFAKRVSEISLW